MHAGRWTGSVDTLPFMHTLPSLYSPRIPGMWADSEELVEQHEDDEDNLHDCLALWLHERRRQVFGLVGDDVRDHQEGAQLPINCHGIWVWTRGRWSWAFHIWRVVSLCSRRGFGVHPSGGAERWTVEWPVEASPWWTYLQLVVAGCLLAFHQRARSEWMLWNPMDNRVQRDGLGVALHVLRKN